MESPLLYERLDCRRYYRMSKAGRMDWALQGKCKECHARRYEPCLWRKASRVGVDVHAPRHLSGFHRWMRYERLRLWLTWYGDVLTG